MDTDDIKQEHEVMCLELDSLLKSETPKTCKFLNEYLEHILGCMSKETYVDSANRPKLERVNLMGSHAQEGRLQINVRNLQIKKE